MSRPSSRDQVSTVHPTAPAGLFFKGDPGIPAAMWNGHLANFAPRVGLVWSPHGDGRDTLRIGGAILYDSTETWFNERETTNPPFGNDIDVGSTGTLSNPWAGYAGGNPFPQHPGNLFFPSEGVYVNMPINPKPTNVAQWNVTYQRQLRRRLAGIGQLPGQPDRPPVDHRGNGSRRVSGYGRLHYRRRFLQDLFHHANTNERRLLYLSNPALWARRTRVSTPWMTAR
jgi:hypothetical protein